MWLSEIKKAGRNGVINQGCVTIGGSTAAVMTDTERRNVDLCMPGGYLWIPEKGKMALSVRNDNGEQCLLGYTEIKTPEDMEPGEILIISAGGAEITLKNDGRILLKGTVFVEGSLYINGDEIN